MIEFLDGCEERVNVVPAGQWGNIAAGGNDEVGILAALLHNVQRGGPDGLGGAAAELLGGADVAHADDVGRSLLHDLLHPDGVAEVVGVGTAAEDGVQGHVGGVAAIMIYNGEALVLHSIRISRAKELLEDTNYTVMDIAVMVGYSSNSTFTRAFRSIVGMTPKEYRDWMGMSDAG